MPEAASKILIICQHNSGRSQIAEAYLRHFAGGRLEIDSAGLEPAPAINPLVVEVMKEEGIDISQKKPQSVFELYRRGNLYGHVITVCFDAESKCPVFPGVTKRWHHPFPDPASVEGTEQEKLEKVRQIRDMIKEKLLNPSEGEFSFKDLLK
ncbi:MAG: arsenate reductase ArsC [Syntrophobacteraceae bacterium]|nr:arsenate reductase ArsC [Syntrophobacteraceae bacterium]